MANIVGTFSDSPSSARGSELKFSTLPIFHALSQSMSGVRPVADFVIIYSTALLSFAETLCSESHEQSQEHYDRYSRNGLDELPYYIARKPWVRFCHEGRGPSCSQPFQHAIRPLKTFFSTLFPCPQCLECRLAHPVYELR